jgi:hypothetical protein
VRILAPLVLIGACIVAFGLYRYARGLAEPEYYVVLNWLECDHCSHGEREAVQALGSRAIPALASVLKEVPELISVATRRELENTWSPEISEDREGFIEGYLAAVKILAQTRAAISLGDLGAEHELREALEDSVARGYGEDLIRVIRGALQWAGNDGPLVAVVRVLPNSLTLPMGSTGALAVSVQDEFGNPLELPLDWRSSDTSILRVDSAGVLTPVAPGPAAIVAVANGVPGQAVVTVVPAQPDPPRIHILYGDHQDGPPGTVLPERVRVRILAEDGTGVSGIYPVWRVLRGGGSVKSSPEASDDSGVASAQWTLGAPTEPQRLEARLPGSNAVVFRARVVPG